MKILLASSSPNVIHKLNCESENRVVDIAETGEEVFRMLDKNRYDCLITEVNLNDIDIWSLARFIKANVKAKNKNDFPIFIIKDESINYPSLLSSNYGVKIIDFSELRNIYDLINSNFIDRPSILIIEDDSSITHGMQITLQKEYEVDICHTGQDGIECWNKKKQDLILLDLMMPGISGEEVLREIRSINPYQSIIIISARTETEVQQKLILLGANDYLIKPFSPEGLNKACRVVLTQELHRYELNINNNILDSVVSKLFTCYDALEKQEIDIAKNIINQIIYSMPNRLSEDLWLSKTLE